MAGAAGGAVLGSFFHKGLGLSDEDNARLEKNLEGGQAALVVMADADEVAPTSAELKSLGGEVESYEVPEETMNAAEGAEEVKPADSSE